MKINETGINNDGNKKDNNNSKKAFDISEDDDIFNLNKIKQAINLK